MCGFLSVQNAYLVCYVPSTLKELFSEVFVPLAP